jgi:hypothetical protein
MTYQLKADHQNRLMRKDAIASLEDGLEVVTQQVDDQNIIRINLVNEMRTWDALGNGELAEGLELNVQGCDMGVMRLLMTQ